VEASEGETKKKKKKKKKKKEEEEEEEEEKVCENEHVRRGRGLAI
jgi:hypothetical protein